MTTWSMALVAAFAGAALSPNASRAAEWGSIKGQFVYKGTVNNEPLQINKDVEFCSKHTPVDETVTVGEDGALQNVFVYLYVARRQKVDIHPDIKPGEPKKLTNKECRFEPRSLTVWTAEQFEVHNEDSGIGHNTNFTLAVNTDFNLTVPNDMPIKRKFDKSEPMPGNVSCNIHPWMHAYVLVRDNPYMAVSGKDGTFEIKDIPAGPQEFVLWHEAKGYLRDLAVGKAKADRKGQVKMTVPAGDTLDLGVIEVTPDILGK